MAAGIEVGGKIYPVAGYQPVLSWRDVPAIECRAGQGHNTRRTNMIRWMVHHWSGGEGDAERLARVLDGKGYGIEFIIDRLGCILQCCDPMLVNTADAGYLNDHPVYGGSVGVEIVNYGFVRWRKSMRAPKLGRDRELYEDLAHGRVVKTAKFYPWQKTAAVNLADAVSTAIPAIRRQVPSNLTVMTRKQIADFGGGHVGHLHLTDRKRDPGLDYLDHLRDHFDASA